MNFDKQEIKALAMACEPARCADEDDESRRLAEFYSELTPETVLALIAEIERLERDARNDAIAYKAAIERQEEIRQERDQLKAESEALRKDAERYRWLRDMRHGPALAVWREGRNPVAGKYCDDAVDAAMAKVVGNG